MLKQIVINGTIKRQIKNDDIRKLDICSFIHDGEKGILDLLEQDANFLNEIKCEKFV